MSVAEHTLGLMLAMARHLPQANVSTHAGKWEKKKFLGRELRGEDARASSVSAASAAKSSAVPAHSKCGSSHMIPYVTAASRRNSASSCSTCRSSTRPERLHHAARSCHQRKRRAC